MSEYYSHTTYPANGAQGSSSALRAELESIEAGTDKLPILAGNGSKIVAVNAAASALEAISTVPVAQGGTAQSSFTDGQLLIGNSSGNTLTKATLTAGANIAITNGNGTISIAATGLGTGSVTSVSVASANGFAGTVATATTTPAITLTTSITGLLKGNGTAISAASAGTDYVSPSSYGAGVATFLATPSSSNLKSAITDETGSGALVFGTSPTIATPTITTPVITGYTETVSAPSAGSAFTVDLSVATRFVFTTNAHTTITLPAPVAGKAFTVDVIYGGAHTLTWAMASGTLQWPAATAPSATSVNGKRDKFAFDSVDTTRTSGSVIGQNYAA
jgi:hypothetical protein